MYFSSFGCCYFSLSSTPNQPPLHATNIRHRLISFSKNLFTESNDCLLISYIGKLSVCNIEQLMPAYFSDAYVSHWWKTNLHFSKFFPFPGFRLIECIQPIENICMDMDTDVWNITVSVKKFGKTLRLKRSDLASKLWKVWLLLVSKKRKGKGSEQRNGWQRNECNSFFSLFLASYGSSVFGSWLWKDDSCFFDCKTQQIAFQDFVQLNE